MFKISMVAELESATINTYAGSDKPRAKLTAAVLLGQTRPDSVTLGLELRNLTVQDRFRTGDPKEIVPRGLLCPGVQTE